MPSPEPENVAQLVGLAKWLAQSLHRELPRLVGGQVAGPRMKELYDSVYLPVLISFTEMAGRHMVYENLPLLREPLHRDLAATQIQFVLDVLEVIVISLPWPKP